jgi:hypothetical protein
MLAVEGGIKLPTHTLFDDEDDSKKEKKPLKAQFALSDEAIEYVTNPDLFSMIIQNGY